MTDSDSRKRQSVLQRALTRYLGAVPKGASKSMRLTATRRISLKVALPFLPPLILVVILIDRTWAYVLLGLWTVLWGVSLILLTHDIRVARRTDCVDEPNTDS
jgi:hypothetical protein